MTSARETAAFFRERHGRAPEVIASAPGRVNLIGEHTDYNGGDVLPIAISRRTYVAVARATGETSRACSAGAEREGRFAAHAPQKVGEWWDYVAAVAWTFAREGWEVPALDVAITGDVPQGAGLGSSGALGVAVGTAVAALVGAHIEPRRIALLAQAGEHGYVGVASGIMDQFASALGREGHAILVQCDTQAVEYVPFRDHVAIIDSGVRRKLRFGGYNERQGECTAALAALRAAGVDAPALARVPAAALEQVHLEPPLGDRARHVVEETGRVAAAVAHMRSAGSIPGDLAYASHDSLRTLYECSTEELDWLVGELRGMPGVSGARLTGAGWGGCVIALGPDTAVLQRSAEEVLQRYHRAFTHRGRVWLSQAGPGARVEQAAL